MARTHDPYRCPQCQSSRTHSMHMVAMAGTRTGNGRATRASIGARGWWSLSGTSVRWTSQTMLAQRYAPATAISSGGLVALMVIGAAVHGVLGALVAFLFGVATQVFLSREPPSGFVCLRCGCEFKPVDAPHG